MHSNEVVDLQKFRSSDSAAQPSEEAMSQYLPAGTTLLVGQYIIDGYLNCGGFGITYTARDSLGRKVAIKECFPSEMVYRDGKAMETRSPKYKKELASIVRNFVTEAHSLANVKHPNIVHVHQIFEENRTAYLAMDFVDGPDLLDMLDSDRKLTPKQVEALTRRILDAIRYLHRIGMLHRDISPDNILVERDGTPVLIDFGAARHFSPDDTEAAPKMKFVKDGYSPQEFYVAGSAQGPFSDLYSFAATVYHVITGAAPVDAQARLAARAAKKPDPYKPLTGNVADYAPRFLKAIDKALSLLPEERMQTAQEWLDRIGPEPAAPAAGLFKPVTTVLESLSIFEDKRRVEADAPQKSRRPLMVASVVGAALVLGGAVIATQLSGPVEDQAAALPAAEATPPELQSIAALPAPTPLVSVWPDGFAALRGVPARDPDLAQRQIVESAALKPAGENLNTPPVVFPGVSAAQTALVAPPPVAPIADLPQPDATVAIDVPLAEPSLSSLDAARPPQNVPVTKLDLGRSNQLGTPELNVTLQSIAPVALVEPATPLPITPDAPRLSLDTTAPAYAPRDPVFAQETGSSVWDIELPFTSKPPRVGDENALVITEIDTASGFVRANSWIDEGLILVGLNGAPLRDGVSLKQQILDGLVISEDGSAQVSVFYRAPRAEVLDQAVLSLPLVRRTALGDGTVLETRKQGTSWMTSVVALGEADTDLQVGDLIVGNASSPTRFTSHTSVETAFSALVQSDLTAADFSILRAGQRQTARWRYPADISRTAANPQE